MLDHVVEDLGRREQQAPVEAHRSRRRAAGPARALAPDLEARVRRAGPGHRGVQTRGDLRARPAAKPGLERDGGVGAGRQPQLERVAAPGHVSAAAVPLLANPEHEPFAQIGDRLAVLEPDERKLGLRLANPLQRALDPGSLLLHEALHLGQREAPRKHHLHPVAADHDAGAASAVGAANRVGHGGHPGAEDRRRPGRLRRSRAWTRRRRSRPHPPRWRRAASRERRPRPRSRPRCSCGR